MQNSSLNIWSPKPQPFGDKKRMNNPHIDALSEIPPINVFHYPIMEIVIRSIDSEVLPLLTMAKDSLCVFVSQNAVKTSVFQIKKMDNNWFLNNKILAIGPTTYKALTDCKIEPFTKLKGQFTSESLLKSKGFCDALLKAKQVFIFSGEGGRKYLFDTLIEKKVKVTKIESYRRIKINTNQSDMLKFLQLKKIDAIFLTSCEVIDLVVEQLSQSKVLASFLNKVVFCMSPRVAEYANFKGFLNTVTAKKSNNQSLINAAIVWCKNNE